MKELYNVETIDTTNNFESDDEKGLAVGSIVKEADEATNEVIFAIDTEADPDALDDSPATADRTQIYLLINIIAIAGVIAVLASYVYNKKKTSNK